MVLLDTNVFIYLVNGTLDVSLLGANDVAYSAITKIEALGYWKITVNELDDLGQLFGQFESLDLDEPVVQRAIKLRQRHRMTLGDAIIAATALESGCELWTANEDDFVGIDDLRLYNPLAGE